MTLTQIVEDRQAELETELRLCREVLVLLRGGKKSELSKGPIVYGNGHHDGKKPKKGPGSNPKTRSLLDTTVKARGEIEKMLRAHPEGMTTKQMTEGVIKVGIPISPSTIHNALRRLSPIKLNNSSSRSIPNTIYALPKSK